MLMDLEKLEWSPENMDLFGIKQEWLPRIIKNSSDDFGKVHPDECPQLANVPITGVLGDQ